MWEEIKDISLIISGVLIAIVPLFREITKASRKTKTTKIRTPEKKPWGYIIFLIVCSAALVGLGIDKNNRDKEQAHSDSMAISNLIGKSDGLDTTLYHLNKALAAANLFFDKTTGKIEREPTQAAIYMAPGASMGNGVIKDNTFNMSQQNDSKGKKIKPKKTRP